MVTQRVSANRARRAAAERRLSSDFEVTGQAPAGVVQAKISAARSGRTLSQVIEDALRQALAPRAEPTRRRDSPLKDRQA